MEQPTTCGPLVGAHCQSSESVTQASSSPQLHLAPCALAKEDSCSCGLVVTQSQEVPPRRLCHQTNRKRTFLLQSHYCRLSRQKAPTCRPQPGQGSSTMPPVLQQPSAPLVSHALWTWGCWKAKERSVVHSLRALPRQLGYLG